MDLKTALHTLGAQGSMLRPNLKTPEAFNAHLDACCSTIQSLKVTVEPKAVPKVTVEVEPVDEPDLERKGKGGKDRQYKSGTDRQG